MTISTRNGDAGETSLGDGSRVQKDDLVISLIGAIDECQAHVGAARAISYSRAISDKILYIERELGLLMGHIARYEGCECPSIELIDGVIAEAESKMEKFDFLLPGESQLSADLHIARTVARRAERLAVILFRNGQIGNDVMRYLNRLSDYFYALVVLSKLY
jgi:cob(I)alamin adenosyltransferase